MASGSAGSELDELSRNSYQQELDRSLHPLRSLIMGVASCGPIGSVFAYVPALLFICGMFSWWAMIIAAVFCIFQGLAYAEVGSAYPVAGGEYSMVGRVLGKWLGIITFGLMSAMYIFVPTAAALAAGGILGVIWPWAGTHTHVIAVCVIIYAASVSFLKVKLGTWVAAFFVAVQIVALLIVTILGVVHWHSPSERLFSTQTLGANGGMTNVTLTAAVVGITVAFFIYQGFGNVIIFSEETKKAKARIGGAAMLATVTCLVAILVPTTALLLGAPSVKVLLTSPAPLADTISSWGGAFFGKVISFIVFLAIIDLVTASMMAFTRVYWSGGRDNVWPTWISKKLAYVNPTLKTPWVAVIVFALICAVFAAVSTVAAIVTFTGIITLAYALLMAIAAVVIRLKKNPPDRYKMPLWPLWPVLLIVACVLMGTQQKASDLYISLAIAAGFLIYYLVYLRPRPDHWKLLDPIVEDVDMTFTGAEI
ncbi:MAG TPA: APC family permease [Thermoleophilia bacterium]|nr:APC family permease [Thermoleophilia bacterium]